VRFGNRKFRVVRKRSWGDRSHLTGQGEHPTAETRPPFTISGGPVSAVVGSHRPGGRGLSPNRRSGAVSPRNAFKDYGCSDGGCGVVKDVHVAPSHQRVVPAESRYQPGGGNCRMGVLWRNSFPLAVYMTAPVTRQTRPTTLTLAPIGTSADRVLCVAPAIRSPATISRPPQMARARYRSRGLLSGAVCP
jgi:hypothetical protein